MTNRLPRNGQSGHPASNPRWLLPIMLTVVCVAVVGVYLWIVEAGAAEYGPTDAADQGYNRLVGGFRAGTLSLKGEVPAGLAQLSDPYDPAANAPFRYARRSLHDLSFYKGRLYLYFGVTPALVLFWPWVTLTGHYLYHKHAVAVFCAVGFLTGVGLLHALWRRFFSDVSAAVVVAGALALGLATSVPLLLQRPEFYEVAVGCGSAMIMLALAATWRALQEPARRGWWLAAASLAYGLAVGARPSLLFGAVILLIPLGVVAGAAPRHGRRPFPWGLLAAAAGPMITIGLGLMLYNYLRFDNPLEFGQRYQLAGDRQAAVRHFDLGYLWFNFRLYFLAPMKWERAFPFVSSMAAPLPPPGHVVVDEHPLGLLTSVPLVWLALAVPLAWRARTAETRSLLRAFMAAAALLFVSSAVVICLFYTTSNRYEVDFAPGLVFLAVVGILAIERSAAGWRPAWRLAVRAAWSAMLAVSIAINLLASLDRYAFECYSISSTLLQAGQPADARAKLESALRVRPGFADAHSKLGTVLNQLGRVPEAVAQFQQALALGPAPASTHAEFGTVLAVAGRTAEAMEQFQQALALQPDLTEAHYNLGIALLNQGRRQEAIEHLQQVVRAEPDDANTQAILGNVLLKLGRPQEAVAHYQAALRIQPGLAALHFGLGAALLESDRTREAISELEEALRLEPGLTPAQRALEYARERLPAQGFPPFRAP
jgi:tetratricopeptide (TPR) repeat protein